MNNIVEQFEKEIKEKTGIDLKESTMPDMQTLKEKIIAFAKTGGDFGCECYYCESSPIDLVNRGDAIPMMYIMGETICYRCTDAGSYVIGFDHIKNIAKKIELLKVYSSEPALRDKLIKELSAKLKKQEKTNDGPGLCA